MVFPTHPWKESGCEALQGAVVLSYLCFTLVLLVE